MLKNVGKSILIFTQNQWKSVPKWPPGLSLAIDNVIFGLSERCQEFMFFLFLSRGSEKLKILTKERPRGTFPPKPLGQGYRSWRLGPQGGHARDQDNS